MKILNFEGQNVLDSRDVAKMIGKRHGNLVRDIEKYVTDISQNSKLSSDQFFVPSTYQSGTGKNYKCYLLTREGCEFVANKMTGKKGNQFTAQYVSLFNSMKQEIQSNRKPDSYMIEDPIKRAKRWIEEREAYERVLPKAQYFDKQMRNPGLMTITEIAESYGMSSKAMNQKLHELGVQYRQGRSWVLYQQYKNKGYAQPEPYAHKDNNGVTNLLKWTQKGKKFIYDLLAQHGIKPVLEQPGYLGMDGE